MDGKIKLRLDISHNLYRVPDDVYVGYFAFYTEPKKGILVWTESEIKVIVKDGKLMTILGAIRPVRNILWTYQILFLDIEIHHKDGKIKFDHRFKLQYAVEPATSSPEIQ